MLNGLDLFSGIGGMSIALSEWVRPIAYCEIDPYCQGVLLSKQSLGYIQSAPIWDDIRSFPHIFKDGYIDIIYGGFPCQDISVAGRGKGLEGERSGLFFEIVRLAKEIKPKFIFLENVPAICSRGGLRVAGKITALGYDCRWCVISADEFVDQKRNRWFLLAKLGSLRQSERASERIQSLRNPSVDAQHSDYKLQDMESWASYARSMRKDDGLSQRVDRIRALGNAVVPAQAREAFRILSGYQ